MRISMMLAAAAVCLAAPAWADDDNGAENPDDKIVCRRSQGAGTGSNLRRAPRVCRTRAEWREIELALERQGRSLRDGRPSTEPRGGMGGGPQ